MAGVVDLNRIGKDTFQVESRAKFSSWTMVSAAQDAQSVQRSPKMHFVWQGEHGQQNCCLGV